MLQGGSRSHKMRLELHWGRAAWNTAKSTNNNVNIHLVPSFYLWRECEQVEWPVSVWTGVCRASPTRAPYNQARDNDRIRVLCLIWFTWICFDSKHWLKKYNFQLDSKASSNTRVWLQSIQTLFSCSERKDFLFCTARTGKVKRNWLMVDWTALVTRDRKYMSPSRLA